MTTPVAKPWPRRIPWPVQWFQAALTGAIAACVTALQSTLWNAVFVQDQSSEHALSFVPIIIAIASVLGAVAGSAILVCGHAVRAVVSMASASRLASATAAGATVLLLGVAVALAVGFAGYGLLAWPILVASAAGAALLYWQTMIQAPRSSHRTTRSEPASIRSEQGETV